MSKVELNSIAVSLTACPVSINFRNTFFANSLEYFQMHQICSNQSFLSASDKLKREDALDLNRKE
jgi:hypothetical protein